MNVQPVQKRTPLAESDLMKVFDVPHSMLYHVEAITPDGTVRVFDGVRAYTSKMELDGDGKLSMQISAKSDRVGTAKVSWPYNYLCRGNVLCTLKLHEMRIKSDAEHKTFGLNYDLFCLPWETCILFYKEKGAEGKVCWTSRCEWDQGEMNVYNQEVQMFLAMSQDRWIPDTMARLVMRKEVTDWMARCDSETARKR